MDGDIDGILYNRDANGNLCVRYMYVNDDGSCNSDYNWIDNDFNDNNPAVVAGNFLHFSPGFLAGEFCFSSSFTICPFQPPSILPTSSIFNDKAIYLDRKSTRLNSSHSS